METVLIVLLVVLLLGGGAGATLVGRGSAPLALDLLRESLITQTLSFRSYAARPTLRVSRGCHVSKAAQLQAMSVMLFPILLP